MPKMTIFSVNHPLVGSLGSTGVSTRQKKFSTPSFHGGVERGEVWVGQWRESGLGGLPPWREKPQYHARSQAQGWKVSRRITGLEVVLHWDWGKNQCGMWDVVLLLVLWK